MTKDEKSAKIVEAQAEAKDLQARVAFLHMQKDAATKEIEEIKVVLAYAARKFEALTKVEVTDAE